MAVKNVEKSVYDRIVDDLQGIDGTGNFNFDIGNDFVFDTEFIPPEQATSDRVIVMGSQRQLPADPKWRTDFELPMRWEIWAYVQNVEDPAGDANKILSDIRVAILADEQLNELVTDLTFESEMEVLLGTGYVRVVIHADALHQA